MPPESSRAVPRAPLPWWLALLVSAAGGLLLTTAHAPLAWWPVVFLAIPLALVPLIGRRIGAAFLVGLAFGAAFFLVNLSFTGRYLGPLPWIALSTLEALLTAVGAVLITLAYRWTPRVLPGSWARLILLPVLVAALWTLRELVQGSFPYGGFPWGRIGVTQADGALADVVSWVGMSGLSFLIVFACAAAIEWVRCGARRDLRTVLPTALVMVMLLALPQFPTTAAGSIRVGAVQGNGPAGYFDERARYDVLNAQLKATTPLIGEEMDVLLWPEGGVDSDPTANGAVRAALDTLAERVEAPLLVSAVTAKGEEWENSALVWKAGAENPVQTYAKRHPVPFGEYVPDRAFWRQFAPELIDLIKREYLPGTGSPVVRIGDVPVGLAICFDVIYDDVVWEGAQDGAQVYMFQTNNADFRGTSENLQQLAFARMRAIETGRSVVNISTVGTSQVIAPDGSTLDEIGVDVAGTMLQNVPLRTGLTPAVVLGPWIQGLLGYGSVLAVALLGMLTLRRRRRGHAEEAPVPQEPTPRA